ncbi:uncharacterized protein LOC129003508 [Macrosteles quadrilineatus]|uniref:uncharacterized protein LOC129003508 n=1 Tax=Macrosteles quadrilineatus TaxID=74068 RepID=UPI0023E2F9BA|nr:uncharacterized protein LOC129003508 [Macrosteles quadrilineatus]
MNTGCGMQAGPPTWRQSSVAPRRPPLPPPVPLDDPIARNKVSTRCFWNACKALSFGLLLMMIGAAMATIGYYADQLSAVPDVRSNTTVALKSRGFHLHNLSYAGPIVMGVGGFIVVAACVMTFEARDSAAKVVPTRLKYSTTAGHPHRHSKLSPAMSSKFHSSVRTDSRRSTTKWEQSQVFRAAATSPGANEALNRRALTAAFIQFSKNLQAQQSGPLQATISKSPSAPNLADTKLPTPSISPFMKSHVSPRQRQKRSRNSLRPSGSGCTLLNPHALLQRQALSMDNPDYNPYFSPPRSQQLSRQHSGRGSKESIEVEMTAMCQAHGSQASMAMDLHLPNDCPVTLRVRDRTKRSDTATRHAFVRQSQIIIDDDDLERRETHSCSPRLPGHHSRAYDEITPYSRSTPHSRRESLTKPPGMRPNVEDYPRSRSNTGDSRRSSISKNESRRSSISKKRYSRANTEERRRRGSTTSDKRSLNVSRSSSYEKQRPLEGQSSFCSVKSDAPYESGSETNAEEFDRKSDTYIVIEEVDVQLPIVSCSGEDEIENKPGGIEKSDETT